MKSQQENDISLHPDSIRLEPNHLEYWLECYLTEGMAAQSFYAKLMDCVVRTGDIPASLRRLPANLLEDFKDTIGWVAAKEKEEDFIVIGDTVLWGVKEARKMMQWLAENPNPQLGPPVERAKA